MTIRDLIDDCVWFQGAYRVKMPKGNDIITVFEGDGNSIGYDKYEDEEWMDVQIGYIYPEVVISDYEEKYLTPIVTIELNPMLS